MKYVLWVLAVLAVLGGVYWYLVNHTGAELPLSLQNATSSTASTTTGGVHTDRALSTSQEILGKWKSIDDPKFVREFESDGTVKDWYDDKVDASGTWRAYTTEHPAVVSFPLEAGSVYVQLMMSDDPVSLNFQIVELTGHSLQMVYMEHGGMLRFVHID